MVEMQYIMDRAISKGVKALVTTGKDAVKIPGVHLSPSGCASIYP